MKELAVPAAGILTAYLLGAIPFGLLVSRLRGVDIRRLGSGNIGATNVFRCVGKPWGILTFVCDLLKGFLAARAIPIVIAMVQGDADPARGLAIGCACAAVAGHNWPVYLRFKGGKGIATSAGALLGIAWQSVALGLVVWVLTFALTRYVSLASIAAAVTLGASGWLIYRNAGWALPTALTVLALAALWRHRANVQRLLAGTENRFERKKGKESTAS